MVYLEMHAVSLPKSKKKTEDVDVGNLCWISLIKLLCYVSWLVR